MGLYAAPYKGNPEGAKALMLCIRVRGQRWHHVVCFGRLGHYYEDGGCEHTDALLAEVRPEFKDRVKVQPFGDKDRRPKRFAKRPVPDSPRAA